MYETGMRLGYGGWNNKLGSNFMRSKWMRCKGASIMPMGLGKNSEDALCAQQSYLLPGPQYTTWELY